MKRWLYWPLIIGAIGGLVWYCYNNQAVLHIIISAKPIWTAISIGIIAVMISCNGQVLSSLLRAFKIRLGIIQAAFLQVMRLFWAYLLPLKGDIGLQTIYLKAKHHIPITKLAVLQIGMIQMSLLLRCIGGFIAGLIFARTNPTKGLILTLVFALFILGCLGLMMMAFLVQSKYRASRLVLRFRVLRSAVDGLNELLRNPLHVSRAAAFVIMSILLRWLWLWVGLKALEIDLDLIGVLLLSITSQIGTLLTLIPGNLGLAEVVYATMGSITGMSVEEGFALGLFTRAVTVAVVFPLGIFSNLTMWRFIGSDERKTMNMQTGSKNSL